MHPEWNYSDVEGIGRQVFGEVFLKCSIHKKKS